MHSNSSALDSFKRIKLSQKSASPQKAFECESNAKLSKVSEQLLEYDDLELE